jgi:hypothetical protein
MLDRLQEISLLKEKFILARKELLSSRVSNAQKELYARLFDRILSVLETADGRIVNNAGNIALTSAIDKIFKEFQADMTNLMKSVVSDFQGILDYNQKYFAEFNAALFSTVKQEVTKSMYARIGYNSSGFEKDGFIDSFIKDATLARTVKQGALSAVLNGAPIKDFIKSFKTIVIGNDTSGGVLENHFRSYIYDTYSQFDRESNNQFAIGLDLNYGIYAGGLVDHSRDFCIVRNGIAFTREEIQAFGTPKDKFGGYTNKSKGEFAGKWSKNQGIVYVPERDLGCNRCGHFLNWVSYLIAKSIRPDISKSKYDTQKP